MTRFALGFFAALIVCCLTSGAKAAAISWGTPTTIGTHGDADVAINGTLEYAYAFGGTGTQTLNGVSFTGTTQANNGSQYTTPGGNLSITSTNGVYGAAFATNSSTPISSISAGYNALINGAAFSPDTNPFNVSLNNLAAGTYEVQVWVDDSRGPGVCCQDRSEQFDSGPTLLYNTTQSAGGAGQWVIGTFTLTSPGSESFTLTSFGTANSSSAQINALEVRMVPEPSSVVALCGLGAVGLFIAIRRRSKS